MASLNPRSGAGLSMAGDEFGRCSRGEYVARDAESGQEVARHPDQHCHDWAVTLGPVEFTDHEHVDRSGRDRLPGRLGRRDRFEPGTRRGDHWHRRQLRCSLRPLHRRGPSGSTRGTTLSPTNHPAPIRQEHSEAVCKFVRGLDLGRSGLPTSPAPGVIRPSNWPADVPWPPCSSKSRTLCAAVPRHRHVTLPDADRR